MKVQKLGEKIGLPAALFSVKCLIAAMLALREDPEAKQVSHVQFAQALEVVPPSITDDTVKYYEQLGRQLMKRGRDSGRRSEDDLYT